jgi:hypothetical protein
MTDLALPDRDTDPTGYVLAVADLHALLDGEASS